MSIICRMYHFMLAVTQTLALYQSAIPAVPEHANRNYQDTEIWALYRTLNPVSGVLKVTSS